MTSFREMTFVDEAVEGLLVLFLSGLHAYFALLASVTITFLSAATRAASLVIFILGLPNKVRSAADRRIRLAAPATASLLSFPVRHSATLCVFGGANVRRSVVSTPDAVTERTEQSSTHKQGD